MAASSSADSARPTLTELLQAVWQAAQTKGDCKRMAKALDEARPYFVWLARRFAPEVEVDDCVQEGLEGLLQAVGRYDPDKGVQFATYAMPHVTGRMRHFLRARRGYEQTGEGCSGRQGRLLSATEPLPEDEFCWELGNPRPESRLSEPEANAFLALAMERLRPDERQALAVFWREGCNESALARALKLSRPHAHALLSRVRSKLAAFMDEPKGPTAQVTIGRKFASQVTLAPRPEPLDAFIQQEIELGTLFVDAIAALARPEAGAKLAEWLQRVQLAFKAALPPNTVVRKNGRFRVCALWSAQDTQAEAVFQRISAEALEASRELELAEFVRVGRASTGKHGTTFEELLGHALAQARKLT